jgi:hypothetical protein
MEGLGEGEGEGKGEGEGEGEEGEQSFPYRHHHHRHHTHAHNSTANAVPTIYLLSLSSGFTVKNKFVSEEQLINNLLPSPYLRRRTERQY